MKLRVPGGIYIFLIAFAIGLGELYIVRKAYLAISSDPVRGTPMVPVNINGTLMQLELDTGTARTAISAENGAKAGLASGWQTVNMRIEGGTNLFTTEIEVAGSSDSGGTDILSMNDVHKAGLLAVLGRTGNYRLAPAGSSEIPTPLEKDIEIEYEDPDTSGYSHIGYVDATINGQQIQARIDTGSPRSNISMTGVEALGLEERVQASADPYYEGIIPNVSMKIGNSPTITATMFVYREAHPDPIDVMIGQGDLLRLGYTQVYGGNQSSRLTTAAAIKRRQRKRRSRLAMLDKYK